MDRVLAQDGVVPVLSLPMRRGCFPVFPTQAYYPRELISVVGDQDEIISDSRCGDHEVVGADQLSGATELIPDDAVVLGTTVIEGVRPEGKEEVVQ